MGSGKRLPGDLRYLPVKSPASEVPDALRRKLRLFQLLSLALAVTTGALGYRHWKTEQSAPAILDEPPGPPAPHHDEIEAMLAPLRYTFLPVLTRQDVKIQVDFKRGLWTLKNIHLFDSDGRVQLAEGNAGLCGDLAVYTYNKIEPILRKDYEVKYVRAAESKFFPAPLNLHIVLSIIDRKDKSKVFILDPSFARYGPLSEFNDYLFFEHLESIRFAVRRDKDNIELINRATPVLISKDIKLSLIVTPENNQFNRENFSIGILRTLKNTYMPRTIFRIGRRNAQEFVDDAVIQSPILKNSEEYAKLKEVVQRLYRDLEVVAN